MSGYDLHTHSTFSDGVTTIEHNLEVAARIGLEGIGVTDHDTTAPFALATEVATRLGLDVVLGTEFSAEEDGVSIHLLGYGIDPTDPALGAELARLRDARGRRARAMVAKLQTLGVPVRLARVEALAAGAPIGRPHVAAAVVELGAAASLEEVFDRYLADGGPAYVPKHAVRPERAVELLRAAGGVAVLAHPGLFGARDGHDGVPAPVIERLAAAGLAGLEVDHPDHTEDQRRHYRGMARSLGLLVTGGSDHHGAGARARIGVATTPREVVEALRARCRPRS
ncbi:MAG: PHP domain-containing protein [Nitriliruptoraceae bacterium]